ncbi:EH signature domain-containing protein [Acetonema longum]|uniref:Zorya protein ZorC EH domain-containing protein n=1 Tax=Acetonema longum DSM 6540 TaxID=1009370 RepID=F7NEZ8_9FIRM|nr:EH signature domain-containing protein [Acetonema longum]EGO65559.1 hypothetical protein ALO_03076 [Acetonema longum DSM 6540]
MNSLLTGELSDSIKQLQTARDFGRPQRLTEQADAIVRQFQAVFTAPHEKDVEEFLLTLRRRWIKGGQKGISWLRVREIKLLPWVIYSQQPPRVIDDDYFRSDILQVLRENWQISLRAFIAAYLMKFELPAAGQEAVRRELENLVRGYAGNRTSLSKWRRRSDTLFVTDALPVTARLLGEGPKPAAAVLEQLGFDSRFATSGFLRQAVVRALETLVKSYPRFLERLPALVTRQDLTGKDVARFDDIAVQTAGTFIVRAGPQAPAKVRDLLCCLYLRILGDPDAAAGRFYWRKVSPKAAAVMTGWIIRLDLEMFFSLLGRLEERRRANMYRYAFWQAFLPYISQTWLAISPGLKNMSQEDGTGEYLASRRPARLVSSQLGQALLLIRLGDYVFAQWSQEQRIMVWTADALPLGREAYGKEWLRTPPLAAWDISKGTETYLWQRQIEVWIYHHTGRSRVISYQMEDPDPVEKGSDSKRR